MNDQKLDQDNYHQYASPDSTLSSGYGEYYGGFHHEETLPEVRADNSPQALSNAEAQLNRRFFEDREPKYPVILDDAPKVFLPDDSVPSGSPTISTANPAPETEEKRIFGLKRRIFFSILVVLVVIIAMAVGGGIGGAMASKSRSKASTGSVQALSTSSEASSSTPAPAPATASPSSTNTTSSFSSTTTKTNSASPSPTIQFLNNQTTPSQTFSFQGFSSYNYDGNATSIIHAEGGTDFPFQLNSYVWLPNTTACCLSFCVNATNAGVTGWWCDERYQPKDSGPFGRIFVWCGQVHSDANAVCV